MGRDNSRPSRPDKERDMALSAISIVNKKVSGNKRVYTVDLTMGATSEAVTTSALGLPLGRIDEVIATSRSGTATSFSYSYTTATTGTLVASAPGTVRAQFIGR
jgi:hypothetical protein